MDIRISTMIEQQGLLKVPLLHNQAAELEYYALLNGEKNNEKMHYAMAAKWTSQDSTIEEFSPQYLYKWLHNCIANVMDQYNYQVNKGSFESSKNW